MSAYPIITEKNFGSAGGAEIQLVSLANQLIHKGYTVSFITLDYGQPVKEYVKSFDIFKAYRYDRVKKTCTILKILYILRALMHANADLYICSADSHGILSVFCLLFRKKFIFRIPSDQVTQGNSKSLLIRLAESLDIKRANIVVAQSEFQKRMLKKNFKVNSVVIKNSFLLSENISKKTEPPVVLWVGSISSVKQPHLFIKLAESIPTAHFQMIGGRIPSEQYLFDEIQKEATHQKNLTFYGFIPYNKINVFFEKAAIFVNTSKYEGFPNTFLQAWAFNVPVVSLNVDPDDVISQKKLGFFSRSFTQLIFDVNQLLDNKTLRISIGLYSRKYVETEHNVQEMSERYIQVFNDLEG